MATGTVKFFNESKGFGFIKPEGGMEDLFVHISGLLPGTTLKENDKVMFEIEQGKKGKMAVQVEKLPG